MTFIKSQNSLLSLEQNRELIYKYEKRKDLIESVSVVNGILIVKLSKFVPTSYSISVKLDIGNPFLKHQAQETIEIELPEEYKNIKVFLVDDYDIVVHTLTKEIAS